MRQLIATALVAGLAGSAASAAEVVADVRDRDNTALGAVRVEDTASGMALVTLQLATLPEGTHAIHLHETGDCSAPDFTSAGGHVAGERMHGVRTEGGPHPGDMPNLTVTSDGVARAQVFLPYLDVETHLRDADGAAFVMHQGADDYESQPAGAAGPRIACGEFLPAE